MPSLEWPRTHSTKPLMETKITATPPRLIGVTSAARFSMSQFSAYLEPHLHNQFARPSLIGPINSDITYDRNSNDL